MAVEDEFTETTDPWNLTLHDPYPDGPEDGWCDGNDNNSWSITSNHVEAPYNELPEGETCPSLDPLIVPRIGTAAIEIDDNAYSDVECSVKATTGSGTTPIWAGLLLRYEEKHSGMNPPPGLPHYWMGVVNEGADEIQLYEKETGATLRCCAAKTIAQNTTKLRQNP